MAEKVLMLALSPTMDTGTIAKWHVKEGERVGAGDVLCEVETDKAVMDYESTVEGVLLKILLAEGGQAAIGEAIAVVGEQGENIERLVSDLSTESETMPSSTEKAVPVKERAAEVASAFSEPLDSLFSAKTIRSSPLARKLAKEADLDIEKIAGSGPGGRIIQRDIAQAMREQHAAPVVPQPTFSPATAGLTDNVVRVSQKRKIIAQRLSESKYTAPHYYLKVVVGMDDVLQARKTLNAHRKEKVSLNAFLLKFVAETLKKHPMLNATWNNETIIQHGSVDLGLAVAQPDGLITPVVRDCANKGILLIDRELNALIQKAQTNRLQPEEYTGATFTVSSLGSFGIREFTAIINPPGSAILAIGEIHKEPVVDEHNQIVIRSNMILTLSCDHRVVDGAVGAAFMRDLKQALEHPIQALY